MGSVRFVHRDLTGTESVTRLWCSKIKDTVQIEAEAHVVDKVCEVLIDIGVISYRVCIMSGR